jgi:hypothetical protein
LNQNILGSAKRIGHVHIRHLFVFGQQQGFHKGRERRVLGRGQDLVGLSALAQPRLTKGGQPYLWWRHKLRLTKGGQPYLTAVG